MSGCKSEVEIYQLIKLHVEDFENILFCLQYGMVAAFKNFTGLNGTAIFSSLEFVYTRP